MHGDVAFAVAVHREYLIVLLGFPKSAHPSKTSMCCYLGAVVLLSSGELLVDQPPKKISKIIVIIFAAITGIFRYATA